MGEVIIVCFDEFFRFFLCVWFVLGWVLIWYVSWEFGSIYLCNVWVWWIDFSWFYDVDVVVGCWFDSKVILVSIYFKYLIYGCIGLRFCWRVFYINLVVYWWIWYLEVFFFIWFWSVFWYLVIVWIVCNVFGCFVFYVYILVCYDWLLKVYFWFLCEVFLFFYFFLLVFMDGVFWIFRFD